MDEEKQVINEEENKGLSFKDILFIIRKNWIAIVAFLAVCTIAGFVWSKVEAPLYQSTGTMLVSYESGKDTQITTDYNFSNYITNTYVSFIKEQVVIDKAVEKIEADSSIETKVSSSELKSNLSVSANSLILTVSYTANDPEDAKKIVDIVINTASEIADSPKLDENGNPVINATTGEVEPKYRFLNGNLTPVSDAQTGKKVSHTLRNTAIGAGAGLVLAVIYTVIRELCDNTFKSSEEIERVLNIPVLAGIPDYHFDDEKKGGKK